MRKLIINIEHGFEENAEEMIRAIAKTGWDGVFTDWYENGENVKIAKQVRKAGLMYQSVHAPFDKCYYLWEDEEKGEEEYLRLVRCMRDCADIEVPLVVMHAIIGMKRNTPTELGVERFSKLLDEAQRLGIKIAVENTEGECYLDRIMQDLHDHPALGFCIDTGHEICYDYSHDLITKYGDKLIATHLNDNMKMTGDEITWLDDSHMMPFDGLADWENIAARLNNVGYKGPLTFELVRESKPGRHTHDIYENLSVEEFLALALDKAKKFRELVD